MRQYTLPPQSQVHFLRLLWFQQQHWWFQLSISYKLSRLSCDGHRTRIFHRWRLATVKCTVLLVPVHRLVKAEVAPLQVELILHCRLLRINLLISASAEAKIESQVSRRLTDKRLAGAAITLYDWRVALKLMAIDG